MGTKACENAPSANNRRTGLGIRECDEKGRHRVLRQSAGYDGIAGEPEDARQQRHAADGG